MFFPDFSDPAQSIQLWSGVVGALIGAALSIVVLLLTNAYSRNQSNRQLVEQRDEARLARELEAVAGIVGVLTEVHGQARDLGFIGQLVQRCDLLTLNSRDAVGREWRRGRSWGDLGVSRHPVTEIVVSVTAAVQAAIALEDHLSAGAGALGRDDLESLLDGRILEYDANRVLARTVSTLLEWPMMPDDKKRSAFDSDLASVLSSCREFAVRGDHLGHRVGGKPHADGGWGQLLPGEGFATHRMVLGYLAAAATPEQRNAAVAEFERIAPTGEVPLAIRSVRAVNWRARRQRDREELKPFDL